MVCPNILQCLRCIAISFVYVLNVFYIQYHLYAEMCPHFTVVSLFQSVQYLSFEMWIMLSLGGFFSEKMTFTFPQNDLYLIVT